MPSAVRIKLDSVDDVEAKLDMGGTKKRSRGGAFDDSRSPKKAAISHTRAKADAMASRAAPVHVEAAARPVEGEQGGAHRRPVLAAAQPLAFDAAAFAEMVYGVSEMNIRFSGGSPDGTIVGREGEKKAINAFLDSTVRARKPGSIYICGKPGTGKTAIVKGVCDEMKRKKIRTVSLNGMTLTGGAKDLFTELLKAVCPAAVKAKFDPEVSLRKIFTDPKSDRLTLVVIDEMDALLESGAFQATLCALFEWPKLKGSRLVVVGIANALDLTERFMPMLIRKGCAPTVVSFSAYTDKHMLDILRQRITAAPAQTPPSSPSSGARLSCDSTALELCARRVSAESGDVRKALEACRLACQAAASQAYSAGPVTPGQIVPVKMPHMLKVLAQLFAPQNARAIRELPLHQSLTLCGAIIAIRRGEVGLTEDALVARYLTICRKNGLQALPQGDLRTLAQSLVDCGVMKKTKESRSKVTWFRLDLPVEAAAEALEETPLFKHALLDMMRTSALAQI